MMSFRRFIELIQEAADERLAGIKKATKSIDLSKDPDFAGNIYGSAMGIRDRAVKTAAGLLLSGSKNYGTDRLYHGDTIMARELAKTMRQDLIDREHHERIDPSEVQEIANHPKEGPAAKEQVKNMAIDDIASLDPSPKLVHTQRLIKWHQQGDFSFSDDDTPKRLTLRNTLMAFQDPSTKASIKRLGIETDINKYKTADDFLEKISPFTEKGEKDYYTKPELEHIKTHETHQIHNGNDLIVRSPLTRRSSCVLNRGASWCTAKPENSYFTQYTGRHHSGKSKEDIARQEWIEGGNDPDEFNYEPDDDDDYEERTRQGPLYTVHHTSNPDGPADVKGYAFPLQLHFPKGEFNDRDNIIIKDLHKLTKDFPEFHKIDAIRWAADEQLDRDTAADATPNIKALAFIPPNKRNRYYQNFSEDEYFMGDADHETIWHMAEHGDEKTHHNMLHYVQNAEKGHYRSRYNSSDVVESLASGSPHKGILHTIAEDPSTWNEYHDDLAAPPSLHAAYRLETEYGEKSSHPLYGHEDSYRLHGESIGEDGHQENYEALTRAYKLHNRLGTRHKWNNPDEARWHREKAEDIDKRVQSFYKTSIHATPPIQQSDDYPPIIKLKTFDEVEAHRRGDYDEESTKNENSFFKMLGLYLQS